MLFCICARSKSSCWPGVILLFISTLTGWIFLSLSFIMCLNIFILILFAIVSSAAAKPILADSDLNSETPVLSFADASIPDSQIWDSQLSSDQFLPSSQDGSIDAFSPDLIDAENVFTPGVDSSGLYAFVDEPTLPIESSNWDSKALNKAACDLHADAELPSNASPLIDRDLEDIFQLKLPPLENPSCTDPTLQSPTKKSSGSPQPDGSPHPDWLPAVKDPLNTENCPRGIDGIQPIALCCYGTDWGNLGDRIAVARFCYTCEFGMHYRSQISLIRLLHSDAEVLILGWTCATKRCCKIFHDEVSPILS